MKNISLKVLSSLAVLALAVSCGKKSDSGSSDSGPGPGRQAEEAVPVDGSNIVGHFQAKFTTLNPHVNGTIPGSANFFRKEGEDRMYAYVRLFAGGVRAWHMQHVYTGGRCPTMNDDSNGDGFIDIQEAEAVLGKILIPLDSNLGSQESGRRFFPLADLSGYYHYERITSFRRFLRDLQEEDRDPEDDLVKLAPGEGLRLVGKTVLIQGVVEDLDLPETVGTKGRFRATQTLPIVCGVFEKVDGTPGDPYVQDEIPGPVADVSEWQDRPAEGEIPEGETGGTSGSSTNDSDDGEGPMSDGDGTTRTGSTTGSGGNDTSTGTSGGNSDRDTDRESEGDDNDLPDRTTTGGSSAGGSTSGGPSTGSSSGSSGTTGGTSGGSETSSSSSSSSSSSTTTTGGSSTSSSTSTGSSTTGGTFRF